LKFYFKLYLKNEDVEDVINAVKKKLFFYVLQHIESKEFFLVLCIASQRREQSNERALQTLANATDIYVN